MADKPTNEFGAKRENINDALAVVDCKRIPPCCDKPDWRNQMGSRECICINCKKRCDKCTTGNL
jgi:hypothetical protein